ncbi:MAG: M50 family metallopeptidase [Planctomycetaceae bacterium]|nr:M50 family metallopeptidase [Planctomycetaceae bacterium]
MMKSDPRWLTALHEAAHAVAALALGGRALGLAILNDDSGMAQSDELLMDRHTFAVAAGPAAEKLVEQYPAPERVITDAKLLTVDQIEALPIFASSPLMACQLARPAGDRRHCESDERVIALWVVDCHEHQPETWARRAEYAHFMGGVIVDQNADKIVRVATALYARGSLSEAEILSHLNGEI